MKRIIRIIGVLFIVLILILLLSPLIFKGKIIEKVKAETREYVDAKVEFNDLDLSLIRSFPNFNFRIGELTVIGINEFEGDTIAYIDVLSASVNLFSVIRGDQYKINSIGIKNPVLNFEMNEDGLANWDIIKVSEDKTDDRETGQASHTSSFSITLKKLRMTNANIVYRDASAQTLVVINNMDHSLSGDLTASLTTLKTLTSIDDLSLLYNNIPFLVHTNANLKADIEADLMNQKYTFKDNELVINEILMGFDGFLTLLEKSILMDISLETKKNNFKDVLSLIPSIYKKDFDDIETEGNFSVEGYIKGKYSEDILPAFSLTLNVNDAMFKYPDFPSGISNINMTSKIFNSGGNFDNTIISVPALNLVMAGNPIDMTIILKTPISDPVIDATLDGVIDLSTVKDIYPLDENSKLGGSIVADIAFQGRLSSIEAGEMGNFKARGSIDVKDLSYRTNSFQSGLNILTSHIEILKEYVALESFECKIGESDFNAYGKIYNYMPYILEGETLSGTLTTTSAFMNLNDLGSTNGNDQVTDESTDGQEPDTPSPGTGIITVPVNVDFELNSTFAKLIYGDMEMTDVVGKILIRNQEMILQDLKVDMLGGRLTVNGVYETKVPEKPSLNFNLNIADFDIQESYNILAVMEEYVPVAKRTTGLLSSGIDIKTNLDENMLPIPRSINGIGNMFTTRIVSEDIQVFNELADILKIDRFKNMTIDPLKLDFEFIEGALMVKPFDLDLGNIKGQIGGATALDRSINYILSLEIPRDEFGDSFNEVYGSLLDQVGDIGSFINIDVVNLDVIIGGTLDNPTLRTGLKESMENIVEDLKNKAQEELEKKKEEMEQQLKEEAEKYLAAARKQANQIIADAKKRADQIISIGEQAAAKILQETDTTAARLVAEGKKNGPLAELAAKTAALEMKREANKRGDQVISEANNNAEVILNKARRQADAVVQEARDRYK